MEALPTLAAGLLLAATATLEAQSWAPIGPPGGDVRSLAGDPQQPKVVYLGTAGGTFYRSDDAGSSWQRMTPGFPLRGVSLDEIVVDTRGQVFVGYWEIAGSGGGVARSTDGGRSFTILGGIDGESVRALRVAAPDPDMLVAGTISGVFRSLDSGGTWSRITPAGHPELRNVESVAIDPTDPTILYVGTWHLPWKTTDGGRTWQIVHRGMVDDSDVFTLTIDRRDPRLVYGTACTGIYKSTDGAARWNKARGIPSTSRRTRAFAQDPLRPDTFYAGTTEGLWISDDGTTSWRLATDKERVVNTVLPLADGTLLIGTDGAGVLRSQDRARSFSASNRGFSERFISRIVFEVQSGRLFAGVLGDRHNGGVFAARDTRGPWTPVDRGIEGREVLAMAVAESAVLAGTDAGLFEWTGTDWRRLKIAIAGPELRPRIAELARISPRTILAATPQGLLRSSDAGRSWQRASIGSAQNIQALAASSASSVAFAATRLGLYRSNDGGARWDLVSAGPDEGRIRNLLLRPGDDATLFATTPTGLFKSTDGGLTWARRGAGLPAGDITGLAFAPDGRSAWASDFGRGGLFASRDGGDSWAPIATDGLATDRVFFMVADPRRPGALLASTPVGGLHELVPRAADDGQ